MSFKVCYIHCAGYPEIGRTAFFEYSQKAARYGLDVSVVCSKDKRTISNTRQSGSDITVYEIPTDYWSRRGSLKFAIRAAEIVRKNKPDIVHCFSFRGASFIPLMLRWRRERPHFLVDIRSGHLSFGIRGFIGRLTNYLETIPFDAVAFISPEIKTYAIGRDFLRKPTFHFPLGVDWNAFANVDAQEDISTLGLPANALIAVYAGRLTKLRDLSPLIFAVSKVVQELPALHFVFLGDGPDLQRLKSLATDLGIADHVSFLGAIPYSRIPLYYHSAHIGVSYVPQSSVFNGQPVLKNIEYMAAGLAVVATNTSGHQATIVHGINGMLVDDNPESIASGILAFAHEKKMRNRLRKNAQEKAKKYDWHHLFQEHLLSAYKSVLSDT